MQKILSFLLLLISGCIIFAQASAPTSSKAELKRKIIITQIEETLEKSTVIAYLGKCILEIEKGAKDGKPLKMDKYLSYNAMIKKYLKYRWFIADTGLSKKWLSKIQKLIEYMYKTRDIIQTDINNHHTQTTEYKQAVKYFDVAYERFVKLAKKPVKVSSKVQRKAKLNKVIWQKAMRKKYKIKDKPNMVDF